MGPRQLFVLVALMLSTVALGRSASGVLEDNDATKVGCGGGRGRGKDYSTSVRPAGSGVYS